jgi:nitroreductase
MLKILKTKSKVEVNMSVFETIDKRRSIRSYENKIIEKEKIDQLINAAILAPSAANKQKFKLVFVDDEDIKRKLSVACNDQLFMETASHIVAGVSELWKWDQVDIAIVFEHIVIGAVELGLGTCWIGAFNENEVKKILNVPQDRKVVALLTIGYPDENPEKRPRKRANEIICYNKYIA